MEGCKIWMQDGLKGMLLWWLVVVDVRRVCWRWIDRFLGCRSSAVGRKWLRVWSIVGVGGDLRFCQGVSGE